MKHIPREEVLRMMIAAAAAIFGGVYYQYALVNSFGMGLIMTATYFVAILVSLFGSLLAIVVWLYQLARKRTLSWCFASFMAFAAMALFCLNFINPLVKHALLAPVIAKGDIVVAALERYKRDQGKYPKNLDILVPAYLVGTPKTGYDDQQFLYRADQPYAGSYHLSVSMMAAWDELFYEPDQRYQGEYGGTIDRLGRWAYLNE
jgi:hypothetical protein